MPAAIRVKWLHLNAPKTSSTATEASPPGLVAIARLLAREAAYEVFTRRVEETRPDRNLAPPLAKEQHNGEHRKE
jgi:hypothetical protein